MTSDRELKMRCLELAAGMLRNSANHDPNDVIRVANQFFASLPPGPDAPKTQQNMAKSLNRDIQRESRLREASA
jgi:hypothetical protein